jgi:hypothetical protein
LRYQTRPNPQSIYIFFYLMHDTFMFAELLHNAFTFFTDEILFPMLHIYFSIFLFRERFFARAWILVYVTNLA